MGNLNRRMRRFVSTARAAPGPVPDERDFAAMGRKGGQRSGEVRRAKAEAKQAVRSDPQLTRKAIREKALDALYQRLDETPGLLAAIAVDNPGLLNRLLADQEERDHQQREFILVSNPFAKPDENARRWLELLQAGDHELLAAELRVNAYPSHDS